MCHKSTAARRGGLTSKIFRTQNLSIFSQHMHGAIQIFSMECPLPTTQKIFFRQKVYFCPYFHFRCPYLLSKCASGIQKCSGKMTFIVHFRISQIFRKSRKFWSRFGIWIRIFCQINIQV